MNRKFTILLVALVITDIMDGDFMTISALDAIKLMLYIMCFALLASSKGSKNEYWRKN